MVWFIHAPDSLNPASLTAYTTTWSFTRFINARLATALTFRPLHISCFSDRGFTLLHDLSLIRRQKTSLILVRVLLFSFLKEHWQSAMQSLPPASECTRNATQRVLPNFSGSSTIVRSLCRHGRSRERKLSFRTVRAEAPKDTTPAFKSLRVWFQAMRDGTGSLDCMRAGLFSILLVLEESIQGGSLWYFSQVRIAKGTPDCLPQILCL